ncbi:sigma 54-interacting transcriptional regulator [Pelobacter seleniigenes]|uniref:sigma 54-interacting transcriptional regulator n=1 Tax=Pelobacter seleniigenes TaxID=407188 RepID=UPI000AE77965|nr:sigma 54-interacting transcriptional regulator [Pelobacter seleniigenes]
MQTLALNPQVQTLLDATGRIILTIDNDGIVALVSQLAREHLRIMPGIPLESEYPGFWIQVNKVLDGTLANSEIPLQLGNREYLVGVNPLVEEGKIKGAVCILVDSTQLDTMTRRLPSFNTLSRELDTIIDSSSDGLFVCDANANVIRMNPASEKIHQLPASELIGRNMRELIASGFIDRSAALEASIKKVRVSQLQNKNGHKLISIGTPVFDDNNELIRVVVSERDITEIDNLQKELEKQEGMRDGFRDQMLAMQQAELEGQEIIARSPSMIRALQQALKVAKADSSVLILGESGAGKGLIADMIHKHSQRQKEPLIKINCGAIPESLIEAELFGYEKGAFTGALTSGKPGHFELADDGTLFLDEIAELPPSSQVKLLRFLEDGRITRLGSTRSKTLNVRVLAATHQDMEKLVGEGRFRLDLYYRLNVIPIQVPPVRERTDCIVPLIRHYIEKFNNQTGTRKRLTRAALDALTAYPYPGNVRELMNICERLVVMSDTELIGLADLPAHIGQAVASQTHLNKLPSGLSLTETLERIEKELLEKARAQYRNQSEIAAALGVNQSTIARKLKKYHLT